MAPPASGTERSRVLVIGGTGFIGRHIVAASARERHPTFVLVRDAAPNDPTKAAVLQGFRDAGVTLLKGDVYNHESLVAAIKSVDVVISAVGHHMIHDQTRIIDAIKEAGNVKPARSLMFGAKAQIRRAVEGEGIPYTYVAANFSTGRFLPTLAQVEVGVTGLPTDKSFRHHLI
nr:unnamed protein product [Digitaria exilis]